MHPIRNIKEKVGSGVEDIAVTASQLIKDAVVAVSDKVKEFNEKVIQSEEQRFAEDHGYAHGGRGKKILNHLAGISKYETSA